MSISWRARDVAPPDREEAFVEAVSESIVPYGDMRNVTFGEHDEVTTANVGMLRLMRLRWNHGQAARSTRQIRRSDPEMCKIDVTMSGRFSSEQAGRQTTLVAGTFTFVDLSRPHRVAASRAALTAVMFPRALLPLRDKDLRELTGVAFDASGSAGALVTAVIRQMATDLDAYEGHGGARVAPTVLDLISAALAARVDRPAALPAESRRRVLVERIRAYIESNLGDPDLSPRAIAARHHISARFLHRLFEPEESTVADLIRHRRLARCRRDLLDPTLEATPVSAIAARWGLRDAAYFNRLFHLTYGLPPGEYRRLGGGPGGDRSTVGRAPGRARGDR